ncbi:hypothetical protein C6501_13580 [Candidatus Poribacteria bacterium]|nr:MAG: hypothetical protein C6501_13580 [Candidatus Poribacteria bacterium]
MLLILTTFICVTVLFAQNITHNNVKDNVANIKDKWGKIVSESSSNGGLEALVEVEVDIDHSNEEWGWLERDGIKYEAYARVSASWMWGTRGTYDIEAKADDDRDADGDDYSVWTWKWERAKDASLWDEIQNNPGNFPTDDDGNIIPLDDYTADDVRSELGKCDADGTIDRVVPGAGGGNANGGNANGDNSGGCDSGGCDSGGCDDDPPDDPDDPDVDDDDDDDDEYYKTTATID